MVICIYCKEREAKKNSSPPCCNDKKCFERWDSDRMCWEADCMRERGGFDE